MMTLRQFSGGLTSVPASVTWYLADLGEARGKQDLFLKQSPQKLKALREHALIESAVSSNRIEGVEIDPKRIPTVLLASKPVLRDRNEQEVRGYQDALKIIHEQAGQLAVSEETIRRLHAMCRPEVCDAGKYKETDVDIIETYPDGRSRVRFRSVPASETPAAMRELIARWDETAQARAVHPLVALAACNLDFLCIHPFRDGNGRVSRLLMLLQLYQLGYEVGRYISLERLIEENKNRYYETLEQSSHGWHDGKQDPWPYIGYVLYTLKTAYKEFEARVGQVKSPRGEKTAVVVEAVNRQSGTFSVADIQHSCPGVSIDMIRQVLKDLRPKVECLGRGRNARWQKTKRWN
jgi:Fic family protein